MGIVHEAGESNLCREG